MSNLKSLLVLTPLALVAGFLGASFAGARVSRSDIQAADNVLRARRFEAIGDSGIVRAALAVEGGDVPIVTLYGTDGKERMELTLDNVDEPVVMMRDRKRRLSHRNRSCAVGHSESRGGRLGRFFRDDDRRNQSCCRNDEAVPLWQAQGLCAGA
jgi:hypothetical protein